MPRVVALTAALLLPLLFAASSGAATIYRCGNAFRGPLANNFSTVKTQRLSCAKGRTITRRWVRECGAERVCYVSGFTCRYREIDYELATIRCRRSERLVTFATGS